MKWLLQWNIFKYASKICVLLNKLQDFWLPYHETACTVWDTALFQGIIDRPPTATATANPTTVESQNKGDNPPTTNTSIPPGIYVDLIRYLELAAYTCNLSSMWQ